MTTAAEVNAQVQANMTQSNSLALQAVSTANTFMQTMIDLTSLLPPYFYPTYAQYTPQAPDLGDAVAPTSPAGEINTILGQVESAEAALTPPVINDQLTATLPDMLDGVQDDLNAITVPTGDQFSFQEEDYVAELIDGLKDRIETEIDKDGDAYSTAVEAALYNRDQERRDIARQKEIDDTLDEFAGRGFTMPQGVMADAISVIQEKHRIDDETRSKDVMIKQADLSMQNKWKAIEAGLSYDQLILAHINNKAMRALQVATSLFTFGLELARLKVALGGAKAEVIKTIIDANVTIEKLKLDKYGAEVMRFGKKVESFIARIKALQEMYQSENIVFAEKIRREAEQFKLTQSENVVTLENQQANIKNAIQAFEANARSFDNIARVRLGAAQGGADIQKGIATAMLNSLTTVLQLAASGQVIETRP